MKVSGSPSVMHCATLFTPQLWLPGQNFIFTECSGKHQIVCQLSHCRDGSDGTSASVLDKLPHVSFMTLRLWALFPLFYFNSSEELGFTTFACNETES